MSFRRSLLIATAAATLVVSGLVSPHASAEPVQPGAGAGAGRLPGGEYTTGNELQPGAKLGVRGGPPALGPEAAVAPAADAGIARVVCDGDGVSGKRVEVLYVREPSMPDRYTQLQPMFRAWIANMDDNYNDSAARNGASRHLRFVTQAVTGGCQPVIRNVVVPAGSLGTFDGGINAVRAAGYTRADRKYLMLTESTLLCGQSTIQPDEQPGAANANNAGPTYPRVDASENCFGANAMTHELGHALGAVQLGAPHTDRSWHCLDQFDIMCYGGTPTFTCTEWNARRLLDCNGDDYFNVAPAAGGYLATHWNVANSDFLIKSPTPDPDGHPQVGFTYSITSASTGEAIEVINGSAGALELLSQRARTDAPSQRWLMGYDTGLQFRNVNSGQCADTAFSGTTPGTEVLQYYCNGQDGMRWAYLPHTDGTYSIINWKNGLAVTVAGAYPTPLQQQPYTGATNQRWRFNRITVAGPANNGVYTLTSTDTRENAQVAGSSTTAGALVTHAAPSTATSQRWRLVQAGSFWRLVNVNSSLCMDLVTANTTAGTQIRQAVCDTAATRQQWSLRRVADGTFFLVNRFSNRALNMTNTSGSALNQQVLDGHQRSQVWTLRPV